MKQSFLILTFALLILIQEKPTDLSFLNSNIKSNVSRKEGDLQKKLILEILQLNRVVVDSIIDSKTISDYNYTLTYDNQDNFIIIQDTLNDLNENTVNYEDREFEISPLGAAALKNDTITIKKLLKFKTSKSYSSNLASTLAIDGASLEALKLVFDSGTKQIGRLQNAIHNCVKYPFSLYERFIALGLFPNDDILTDFEGDELDTILIDFTKNRVKCGKYLVRNGFDINHPDMDEKKPVEKLFESAIDNEMLDGSSYFYRESLLFLINNGSSISLDNSDVKYLEFYSILGVEELILNILSSNLGLINKEFPSGNLPINTLIESNHFELANTLIEMGADVNLKDRFGSISLHYVAAKSNNPLFKTILDKTVDPNLKNNDNLSALNYSIENGIYKNTIRLLAKSNNINSENNKYLIQDLVNNIYEYPERGWSKDDVRILKLLKNSGYIISETGSQYSHSSLEMVSRSDLIDENEKKALSQLLKFEWDSLSIFKSFKAAYKKIDVDYAKEFFSSGLSYGNSISILSQPKASENYDEYNILIDYIFSNEVNVNVIDDRGYTPIMNAILWNNDYIVEKILQTGKADLKNMASESTAFTIAFYRKKYDLAIKLLSSEGSQLKSGLERLNSIRRFSKDTLLLKQILISQIFKEKILNIRGSNGWNIGNDGLRYRKSLLDYRKQAIGISNDLEVNWDVTNRGLCLCNIIQGESPWFPHNGYRSGGRGKEEYDRTICPIFRYVQKSEENIDRVTIESGSFGWTKLPARDNRTYFDHIIDISLKVNGEIYNDLYPSFFPSVRIKNIFSNNLIEVYQNDKKIDVLKSFEENFYDRSLGDINVVVKGKYRGELNYEFEVEYDIGSSLPILKTDFDSRLNVYFELYQIKKALNDDDFARTKPLEWKTLKTREHLLSELAVESKYKEFAEQDLKNTISELKITERWFKLIWDLINEVIDINNVDSSTLKAAISLAKREVSINDEDMTLLNKLENSSINTEQDKDEILRLLKKIKSSDLITDINFKIFKLQVYILELAQFTSNDDLTSILESPNFFQNYKPGKELEKRGDIVIKPEDLEGKGSIILKSIK